MAISNLAAMRKAQRQQQAAAAAKNRAARNARNAANATNNNTSTSRAFETPNPRAAANQASAARPDTPYIVGGAALATDGSLGARGAETNAAIQNAGLQNRGTRGTSGLQMGAGMTVLDENDPLRAVGIYAVPTTHYTIADDIAKQLRESGVYVPDDNIVQEGSRAFREGQVLGANRPDALRPSEVTQLTRRDAGDPLGAGAGAMGQVGTTGFNQYGMGTSGNISLSANDPIGKALAAIDDEIQQIRNQGGYIKGNTPTDAAIQDASKTQRITDLERQKSELINRKIQQETFTNDATSKLKTDGTATPEGIKEFTDIDGDPIETTPELQQLFLENPMLANAYQPLVDALQSQDNAAATALMMTLQSVGTGEQAAKAAIAATEAAKTFAVKNQSLLTESRDLKRDLADEKFAQAQAERSQFAAKQGFLINQKVEQNIEQELQNRRIASRMGIQTDTGGLGWMRREARQAQEALQFMQQTTNVATAEMSRRAASEHSLSIRSALGQYDASLLQLEKDLDDTLGEIQKTLNLNEKERKDTVITAYKKYMESVNTKDVELAKIYRDANKTLYDNMVKQNEQGVKDQDRAFDFENQLIGLFNANDILKESQEVESAFSVLQGAKNRFDGLVARKNAGEAVTYAGVQQALGVAFQKLLDPGSVVRESEFDRTTKGQPLWDTINGLAEKWVRGGIGLTEKGFMEIYNTALELKEAHMKLYIREMQPIINQATRFNSYQPNVKVDLASVIPQELHSLLERDDFKKSYEERKKMYDDLNGRVTTPEPTVSTGGGEEPMQTVTPIPQPKFPDTTSGATIESAGTANPGANPLSVSADLAKSGGLVEGKDFKANTDGSVEFFNDPTDTMVNMIQKTGFYNETGVKRFQNDAFSGVKFPTKKEFNSWEGQKQFEFVRMIQRIGARKELFGLSNNKRFRFLNVA